MTACAVRADKMAPPSSLVKATANTAREFALSILQIDTQKTHESMRRARFRKPPIRAIRFSRDVAETCKMEG